MKYLEKHARAALSSGLYTLIALLWFMSATTPLEGAYILRNGKLINVQDVAYLPIEEHYNAGVASIQAKKWDEAIKHFRIITISFPKAELTQKAHYFLGIAYYEVDDLEMANQKLSEYLQISALSSQKNSLYFLQAFKYKLAIAERYQRGEKGRLFHHGKMPKWRPAQEDALEIYNEIINTLANNDLVAKALICKGLLLKKEKEYKEAIQTFQTAIKKFPKSATALQAYVLIAKTYLKQCRHEMQNADLLGLSQLNSKKLTADFPKAKEAKLIAQYIKEMSELYAQSLYETGELYERKSHPKAAVLYYHIAVHKFPDTQAATLCHERLTHLKPYIQEIGLKE